MARKPFDFRELQNEKCIRCSNRDNRRLYTENAICTHVKSKLDELPLRCVGRWGKEKVFYLLQYLGIFAQGMKNAWCGNLHYLEICSGPGRLIDYQTGVEFDGSALAILRHQEVNLLKSALFVDINPNVISALNSRIQKLGDFGRLTPKAIEGDYNSTSSLKNILLQKEEGGLNLAFLDPTDLSIPFETVRYLSANINHLDLLINVAIGHDFRRNATKSVIEESFHRARAKYERFLGIPDFFRSVHVNEKLKLAGDWEKELSQLFLNAYKDQLKSLGFCYFGIRPIEHYYHLLYATRNKKGIEFWDKCQKIEFSGQRTLF